MPSTYCKCRAKTLNLTANARWTLVWLFSGIISKMLLQLQALRDIAVVCVHILLHVHIISSLCLLYLRLFHISIFFLRFLTFFSWWTRLLITSQLNFWMKFTLKPKNCKKIVLHMSDFINYWNLIIVHILLHSNIKIFITEKIYIFAITLSSCV